MTHKRWYDARRDVQALIIFHFFAKHRGSTRAALKEIPWNLSARQVTQIIAELQKKRGDVLYRRRPYALTAAGKACLKEVKGYTRKFDQLIKSFNGCMSPPNDVSAIDDADSFPGLTLTFAKEDRTDAEASARHNFPEYFEIASAAEADALIATVSAQAHYLNAALMPRNIPEIRDSIERQCNKMEQQFLTQRDLVRSSSAYARLSAETRKNIEEIGFMWPEIPPQAE